MERDRELDADLRAADVLARLDVRLRSIVGGKKPALEAASILVTMVR